MFLWEDYQYFFNSSWVFLLLTTLQNFLLHRLSPFLSVPFYVIALVYHSPFQKKTFIIILQKYRLLLEKSLHIIKQNSYK